MPKLLNVIVACAENRVIGRDGRLPWHIPEDMRFLHEVTAGQICVSGRHSFESWPRATRDGRRPVVVTSRSLVAAPDTRESATFSPPRAVRSLREALAAAESLPGEIFICGGQRIYEETFGLGRPIRLHLTLVHASIAGDTYFPEWRHLPARESARRESADEHYRYTFLTLEVSALEAS